MERFEQLVEALRCKRDDCEGCDLAFFDKDEGWMCQYAAKDDDAADAIEALLKENKELIEDRPEMVEADGHWEWRKPNGEALMPKQGEWKPFDLTWGRSIYSCTVCGESTDVPTANGKALYNYCPNCGAKMEVHE
jgi:hypothetical protein